jgi:hypothetical protein
MPALEPTILSTSPSYKQRPGTITQSSLAGFIFGDILSIFPSIFPSISVLKNTSCSTAHVANELRASHTLPNQPEPYYPTAIAQQIAHRKFPVAPLRYSTVHYTQSLLRTAQ